MKKLDKEFKYKGYTFNTSVELNTYVEKGINGKTYHTVITNDMCFTDYYEKTEVLEKDLEQLIVRHEVSAKNFVDKKEVKTSVETLLTNLGFK